MCPVCNKPKAARNIYCSRSCRSVDPVYREHLSAGRKATPLEPLTSRIWRQVNKTPDCWNWIGHKTRGYGQITIDHKSFQAHRVVYELEVGAIPYGLQLDHLCRNHSCVRPSHLEPVTLQENVRRGVNFSAVNARKTHCPQGHAYDEGNTALERRGSYLMRRCRTCNRVKARERYARSAK